MYNLLVGIMLVLSVLIILVVVMQPTKTQSSANAFLGGSKELFSQQKARGFEAFLQKSTIVLGTLFFIIAIWIAIIN